MSGRCRRESRINLLGAILSALIIMAAAGALHGAALIGQGDFDFYLDIASFPTGDGEAMQLFQVAVPTKELHYAERDGAYRAEVRITFDLRAGETSVFRKAVQLRDSRSEPPAVKDLSAFLCHIDSCVVAPGEYTITVRVEDLQKRKQTLLGWIRKTYAASEVKEAEIAVSVPPPGTLALGDPILVWSIDRSGGIIPNPMQIYGLRKDTLTALVKAVLPPPGGGDSLRLRVGLVKGIGDPIEERRLSVPVRDGKSAFTTSFDLATYAAGDYRLFVEAESRDGRFAAAGKDFTVAWELLSWQRPVRDLLIEAAFIFNEAAYEQFKDMSLGEQEAALKKFWKEVDPTPQTAVNEAYKTFLARVRYADASFGVYQRGAVSDRGLVYVRFGPPDEIVIRPVPKDRADLLSGIEKMGDEYEIILEGSQSDQQAMMRDIRPMIVSPERQRATRGNVGGDAGSFEIWSYNIKGDPIFPGDRGMTVKSGLRFLFLDADGYGDYRLVGTSEDMYTGY